MQVKRLCLRDTSLLVVHPSEENNRKVVSRLVMCGQPCSDANSSSRWRHAALPLSTRQALDQEKPRVGRSEHRKAVQHEEDQEWGGCGAQEERPGERIGETKGYEERNRIAGHGERTHQD